MSTRSTLHLTPAEAEQAIINAAQWPAPRPALSLAVERPADMILSRVEPEAIPFGLNLAARTACQAESEILRLLWKNEPPIPHCYLDELIVWRGSAATCEPFGCLADALAAFVAEPAQ